MEDSKLQVNNDELQETIQSDSIIVPLKKEIKEYMQTIKKKKSNFKRITKFIKRKGRINSN